MGIPSGETGPGKSDGDGPNSTGNPERGHYVRNPAVAGSFYPADEKGLREMLSSLLESEPGFQSSDQAPTALIAPHAGYIYSGPIAASAYRLLLPFRNRYSRVILIGPAHRVSFNGVAGLSARAWRTPLGDVPLDTGALNTLRTLPFFIVHDTAHASEHSLEVHLPFLQMVLGSFSLVPLLAGRTSPDEITRIFELLDDGITLFVISSDLSHYHSAESARVLDDRTRLAIEDLSPQGISREQACGRVPIQSLLLFARSKDWKPRTLDVRNSGDTAGSGREVVGYGAWAFFAKQKDLAGHIS